MRFVLEHEIEATTDVVKVAITVGEHIVAAKTRIDVGVFFGVAAGLLFLVLLVLGA